MKSKFYSTCVACQKRIKIGDEIKKDKAIEKWVHEKCVGAILTQSVSPITTGVSQSVNFLLPVDEPRSNSFSSVLKYAEKNETKIEEAQERFALPTDITFSKYQKQFFWNLVNTDSNIVTGAVAGSGKTTTLLFALKFIPLYLMAKGELQRPVEPDLKLLEQFPAKRIQQMMRQQKVIFVAYNKHIVKPLKEMFQAIMPYPVEASTTHSLGYTALKKQFVELRSPSAIDDDKIGEKMDDIYPIGKGVDKKVKKENREKRSISRKIVSLVKSTLTDWNNQLAIAEMIMYYGVEIPDAVTVEVISNIKKIVDRCKADTRKIDFDDMLWLPIVHNIPLEKYDFIFGDEWQDMNNCQIELTKRSLAENGRIAVVGDKRQSIYGFRGADVKAMQRAVDEFKAIESPLSICYRCAKSHIKEVQKFVPEIEFWENAKEGEIFHIDDKVFMQTVKTGDMVLCRINSALVKPAFDIIKRGDKAIIRGKDIGKDLVKFIEKFEADSLDSLNAMMKQFTYHEVSKLIDKGKELQADQAVEKYETIVAVMEHVNDVKDLVCKIEMLFSDDNIGVIFSSVHRAKGLEAKNVFILRSDLLPHPKAKQLWEQEQESNIKYVAYTRAKENLYFVQGAEK